MLLPERFPSRTLTLARMQRALELLKAEHSDSRVSRWNTKYWYMPFLQGARPEGREIGDDTFALRITWQPL